jgi:hypothetical protein
MIAPSPAPDGDIITDNRTRVLLMALRQALIICLRALEDYLGMEQSIPRRLR